MIWIFWFHEVTTILHFEFPAIFGGKRPVTLAVSLPGHHMMAQIKGDTVLMSFDTMIMFLCNIIMEFLLNMVTLILNFVYFGGQKLEKGF